MIHLHISGGLPLSCHQDELLLSVGADGLKYRQPDEITLGAFICQPQTLGADHYRLARVHRVERTEDQAA